MRNVLAGLVLIVLAVVAWRMIAGHGGAADVPEVGRAAVDGPATRIDAEADAGTAASRAVERAAFREGTPDAARAAPPPESAAAVVRGRCVDGATAQPLGGCKVEFRGTAGNSQRMNDHVARHGAVVWTDPAPIKTGPDGRFEFRCAPPPPFQYFLDVDAADRVPMSARWTELAPGAVVDVGDVALKRGGRLRGRIVDAAGAPQPSLSVSFTRQNPDRDAAEVRPSDFFQIRTDADGRYVGSSPLRPGTYAARPPRGVRTIAPDRIVLEEGSDDVAIDFQVALVPPDDYVTGVVVDESGTPVARAVVRLDDPFVRGGSWIESTTKDGAFRLEKPSGAKSDAFDVAATLDGFERGKTAAPVVWGARDVRIVLRRCLAVEVTVVDGDADRPLESFAVRCFPSPASAQRRSGDALRLRAAGRHENGVARVEGILRGANWLVVEPTADGALPSPVCEFETSDHDAPPQRVVVRKPVARQIRVRRSNGTPVVGTKVELLRPFPGGGPVDAKSRAGTIEQLWMGNALTAQTLGSGATDESGFVELRGPPGERLFVRAVGPGHEPQGVEATFDDGAPLVIEVPTGATLTGTVGPPQLVARLAKLDGVPTKNVGVSLSRIKDGREETFPADFANAPLSQDGAFRLEGAPTGEWEVRLNYERTSRSANGSSTSLESFLLGRVALAEGAVARRDYSLPHLVPASVSGTARRGGRPLPYAALSFVPVDEAARAEGLDAVYGINTDAEGRYAVDLFAGEYRCFAQSRDGARADSADEARTSFAADVVTVAPGETAARDLVLSDGSLRLTILAPDGKTPVAGVRLVVKTPLPHWPLSPPPTDAQGTTTVEGLPPGSFAVFVVPKSPAAGTTPPNSAAARPPEPIEIGTTPASGSTAAATFVLPASAGY